MSENLYLAHHGVKGMKWGVRNADTLAKYSGRSISSQRIASANAKLHANVGKPVSGSPRRSPAPSGRTTPSTGSPKTPNQVRMEKILASRSNYTDFLVKDTARTVAKLGRTMSTSLYSQQQKTQLGMQLTGHVLNNMGGIAYANMGAVAGGALGAYAVSKAIEFGRDYHAKRKNGEQQPSYSKSHSRQGRRLQ